MSWIRIDDLAPEHPKFIRAGSGASWLWVCGQGYCSRHLTDGTIPKLAAHRLTATAKRDAAILVREHLWHDEGDHYRVHDYHDYQPSKDQVTTRRQRAAERLIAWRRKHGYAHGNDSETPFQTDKKQESSHRPVPVPVPVPVPQEPTISVGGAGAPRPARRPTQGSGVMAGTLPRDHLRCVQPCGRVCFHESQLTEFAKAHGGDFDEAKAFVRAWHERVNVAWGPEGPRAHEPTGAEKFAFWRDRWHEEFAPVRVPSRRKESADDVVERIKRELGAV